MARPKGSKDSYKRVVRRAADEFMPQDERVRDEEPEIQEIKVFARNILDSDEYRQSVKDRAMTGRLLPVEMKMLVELGQTSEPVKRPSQWVTIFKAAKPIEVEMISNICRRAMGKPELPIWTPGTTVARSNDEITGEILRYSRRPKVQKE